MTTTEPVRAFAGEGSSDGRTARRDRNRSAVVEALLDLYHAGDLHPNADAIAERAGLSPRSLFRYFDDADDLCRLAIALQRQRASPVSRVKALPTDPIDDRIEAVVTQRIELFETVGVISLIARLRAPFQPLIAEELTEARSYLRYQLTKLFARELEAKAEPDRAVAIAILDVVCSSESYDLLRQDQGLCIDQAAAVLRSALRTYLC